MVYLQKLIHRTALCFVLVSLLPYAYSDEGVASSTLIRTIAGLRPIWTVAIGDLVHVNVGITTYRDLEDNESFEEMVTLIDLAKQYCQFQPVLFHHMIDANGSAVHISTTDPQGGLVVGKDQLVYVASLSQWHSVSELQDINVGMSFTQHSFHGQLHLLSIPFAHNYYVSTDNIIVHNIAEHLRRLRANDAARNQGVRAVNLPYAKWTDAIANLKNGAGKFFRRAKQHEWLPTSVAADTMEKWGADVSEANLNCFLRNWAEKTKGLMFTERKKPKTQDLIIPVVQAVWAIKN